MHRKQEYTLCRLCLCGGDCLIDVFDENNKIEFRLEKAIEDLLQLKVDKETAFPWLVCSNCLDKVSEFRIFKLRCVESQVVFYNRVKRSRTEEEGSETEPEKKRYKTKDDYNDSNAVPSDLKEKAEAERITSDYDRAEPIVTCDFERNEFKVHIKEEVEDVDYSDGPMERKDISVGGKTTSDHGILKEEFHIEEPEVHIKEEVEDADESDGPMEREDAGGVGETTGDHGLLKEEYHIQEPEVSVKAEEEVIGEAYQLGFQPNDFLEIRMGDEIQASCSAKEHVSRPGKKLCGDHVRKKQVTSRSSQGLKSFCSQGKPNESSEIISGCLAVAVPSGGIENELKSDGDGLSDRKDLSPVLNHKSPCASNRENTAVEERLVGSSVKPFQCKVCGKGFKMKGHVAEHMRIHGGEKPFECDVCGKRFLKKSSHSIHSRTHTGEKPFECEVCKKRFSRKSHVVEHLRIHRGEKPFQCKVCGKSFSQNGSLSMHMRTHTGEKPFQCKYCGKGFIYKGHMVEHLRVHTGEKPFGCVDCGKRFSQKVGLSKHMLNHSGERPYQCKFCAKTFNQKGNLVEHLRIHTGEKPFMCDVCGKRFSHKGSMMKHIQTHSVKAIPVV